MRINTRQSRGIVIVGGGLAGQRCAETLRREEYAGPISIVCAEAHTPYDRPPLSKQLLTGARADETLSYRPRPWYEEHAIELLLGVRAVTLRPAERRLELSDGSSVAYDRVLIATGSRPRTLPMLDGHENVSVLRTLDDSRGLRAALSDGPRLAVIGAGFIGQEVAATARGLGLTVTLIEAAAHPLAGLLGTQLGAWFADLHRRHGVEVLAACTVQDVRANGRVQALDLSCGRRLETDHVLVGVGVAPDVDWLAGSELATPIGVPVDACGRTAIPDVYAAGDAAATFEPLAGRHLPGSHWEAAGRQGAGAARAMLGLDTGESPPASFWSDQYGLRIQYVGHAPAADSVEIDGDLEGSCFTATFLRDRRAVAVLLVNRPRQLPAARTMIEKGSNS